MNTPWGLSQHETPYADGVVLYSTASHGGFHLSPEHLAKITPYFINSGDGYFKENLKNGWFEEDCHWAFVAVTFPELFKPEDVDGAKNTIKAFYPEAFKKMEGK